MRQRQIVNAFAQRRIRCECPVTVLINLRHANQDTVVVDADEIAGNTDTGERRRVIVDHGVTGDKTLNGSDIIEFLRESRRIGGKGIDDNDPTVRHATAARAVRRADCKLVGTIRERGRWCK